MLTKRLLLLLIALVVMRFLLGYIHQTPEVLVEKAVMDYKLGRENSFLPDSVLAFLQSAFAYTSHIENMSDNEQIESGYNVLLVDDSDRNAIVRITIYAQQYSDEEKQEVAAVHEGIIYLELERSWFRWKFGRIVEVKEMKRIYEARFFCPLRCLFV